MDRVNQLVIPCPKCNAEAVLTAPVGELPRWGVECVKCGHHFGVWIDVTKWPAERAATPRPLRLAQAD